MASFADLIDMVDATAKSLLGGDLIVTAATLTKAMPIACEGIVQAFDTGLIDGTIVRREDRRISLLIATLPAGVEPKPGDKITIQGATYTVLDGVWRDPASFMFTCHGRK